MDGTLSQFLNLLDLRGLTWCFVDVRSSAISRGFRIPRNDDVLFYAVVKGTIHIDGVSGGPIALTRGKVVMVLSGEAHRVRTDETGRTRPLEFLQSEHEVDIPPVITCGISGPVSARVLCGKLKVTWPKGLRRVSMPPFVTMGGENEAFGSLTTIRAETLQLAATGTGSAALLTQLASVMLIASLRNHPRCQLLFRTSSWSDPIAHALHLIESEPASDWSVAKLARAVGMGRSSFAARFTEQLGQTPMHVITELRMQHAAELIKQSDLKLIDISERVGYHSEAAFSRRFKQHFGIPPSSMRESNRSKSRLSPDISPLGSVITPSE